MLERKIDRTVVRRVKLSEEPRDGTYWHSRPPVERLAQVTSLALEHHGDDHA